MTQVVVAAVLVALGVAVAIVVRRRDHRQPVRGASWSVPVQLHRSDFDEPDARRLVVVFSSATCDACAATWRLVEELAPTDFAKQRVSYQEHRALHDRYGIDAVPTVVVADAEGVVVSSFVGPPGRDDLAEALSSTVS